MADAQHRFFEVLMDQIRDVKYPSIEIMDRVERTISSQQQLEEYVSILFERVEECQYPSKQLLDRLERLAPIT